jgi:dynein heavy chain, axonemal
LEDINNILNVGTVPNLFTAEERVEICEAVRKDAVEELGGEITLEKIFEFFLERIRNQLKLIVCFSPIG